MKMMDANEIISFIQNSEKKTPVIPSSPAALSARRPAVACGSGSGHRSVCPNRGSWGRPAGPGDPPGATPVRMCHGARTLRGPGAVAVGQAPTLNRAKPVALMPASLRICWTVFLFSLANGCSSSTLSLKKPLTRPSTIRGRACSGLPSSRAFSSAIRRSWPTTRPGPRRG